MLITRYIRIIVLLVGLCPAWLSATAQNGLARVYTDESPLVYEDSWDLWPYSFLNDKGEPEGFNIDLIKMMMKELGIPYVIKLKPQQEKLRMKFSSDEDDEDLEDDDADVEVQDDYKNHDDEDEGLVEDPNDDEITEENYSTMMDLGSEDPDDEASQLIDFVDE